MHQEVEVEVEETQCKGNERAGSETTEDLPPLPPNHMAEPFTPKPFKLESEPMMWGDLGIRNIIVAYGLLNSITLPTDFDE